MGTNVGSSYNMRQTTSISIPEVHTSNRKHTIIDYKKFLEDYADEPPSTLKKKREVNLMRCPSKTCIAAKKYEQSKFVTKPTNLQNLCANQENISTNLTLKKSQNLVPVSLKRQ